MTVRITVNGASREVSSGATLLQLIESLGLRRELVAVEVNQQLVRRAKLEGAILAEGDRVEIVEFVGGG